MSCRELHYQSIYLPSQTWRAPHTYQRLVEMKQPSGSKSQLIFVSPFTGVWCWNVVQSLRLIDLNLSGQRLCPLCITVCCNEPQQPLSSRHNLLILCFFKLPNLSIGLSIHPSIHRLSLLCKHNQTSYVNATLPVQVSQRFGSLNGIKFYQTSGHSRQSNACRSHSADANMPR